MIGRITNTIHIIAYYAWHPAGAGRVRQVDGRVKLERICVLAGYRQYGLENAIIHALEVVAADNDGIEHVVMIKELPAI